MVDPYQKARKDRNILERMGEWIPGFRGYLQAKQRWNSDKLLREHIADQVVQARNGLKEYMQEALMDGDLDDLPKLERLERKFDKIERRIRNAEYGYAGWFNTHKVGQDELEELYNFDLNLLEGVKALQETMAKLVDSGTGEFDLLPEVKDAVGKIDRYWDGRKGFIDGLA